MRSYVPTAGFAEAAMTALELSESAAWLPPSPPSAARRWPGPMVRKLLLLALLGMLLSALLAMAVLSRQQEQQALLRQQQQQSAEVQLVARVLSSKLEQSQKILATVADSISVPMLQSPVALEWLLQQGLPAVRFFDAMVVVRQDGALSVNLRYGQLQTASDIDPAERAQLRRTLAEGKPQVSGVLGSNANDARLLLSMPLLHQGQVIGAVAGVLRLQSPGVLPYALAPPERGAQSDAQRTDAQWVVFSRDGVILAHPDAGRIFGLVQDEPGLAQAYAQWRAQETPAADVSLLHTDDGYAVSLAPVALAQWLVARVSDERAWRARYRQQLQTIWWQAGAAVALLCVVMLAWLWWVSQPLTQLRAQVQEVLAGEKTTAGGAAGGAGPWPQAAGEVDDVVQLCLRLLQQVQQQQASQGRMAWQLAALLEHAPQALALTRDGVVQASSAQAHRLLGQTAQALQGQPLLALLAQEQLAQGVQGLQQQVQAQFRALDVFDAELPLRHRDGSVLWVRAQAQPVLPGAPEQGVFWLLEECGAERQARQQQAWEQGHDGLTRLLNRQGLLRQLQAYLDETLSDPKTIAEDADQLGVLMFLDVDSFHLFNQRAGAAAGDDLLRHMARLIQTVVQSNAWAARLEGDQFVVVLPACTLARGAQWAEQLRAGVKSWAPSYHGLTYSLGLSVGLVPLGAHGRDAQALLHAADLACYQAKRSGRDQVFAQQWAA